MNSFLGLKKPISLAGRYNRVQAPWHNSARSFNDRKKTNEKPRAQTNVALVWFNIWPYTWLGSDNLTVHTALGHSDSFVVLASKRWITFHLIPERFMCWSFGNYPAVLSVRLRLRWNEDLDVIMELFRLSRNEPLQILEKVCCDPRSFVTTALPHIFQDMALSLDLSQPQFPGPVQTFLLWMKISHQLIVIFLFYFFTVIL